MFGAKDIQKSYGKQKVLEGLSFQAQLGQILGIFGLNGSGKTTLLRILSGLDGDFSGSLEKTDLEDVAYMSVDTIYPSDMRVKDAVEFHKTFLDGQDTAAIETELARTGIKRKAFLKSLSSGMRQYVKFLLTVYSGASVCLFDEPLTNLDVNLRERIVQILIEQSSEKRLFVITTHEIKEVERLIDGFFILKEGKLSSYYESERIVAESGKSIEEFYKEEVNAQNE